MANAPMKTLKLPGLSDTYTFIQNDANLTVSGRAADAKKTGDAIAPEYNGNSTYAVGEYVRYNGVVYKCNTAISTAEAWTAAHWTATNVAGGLHADVIDVKSALSSAVDFSNGVEIVMFAPGRINTSGTTVDITDISDGTNGQKYAVVDCEAGDVFTISGTGFTNYRLWCFIDSEGNALDKAGTGATLENGLICAPADSAKLVINIDKDGIASKGSVLTMKYNGSCSVLFAEGTHALTELTNTGWYHIPNSVTSRISDLPSGASGTMYLEVFNYRVGYWQMLTDRQMNRWMRYDGNEWVSSPNESLTENDEINSNIGIALVHALENDAAERSGIINSSGKLTTGSGRSTYELANNGYKYIQITANATNNAYVTFTTATIDGVSSGSAVSLCEGEPARHQVTPGDTGVFEIPSDCVYIEVMKYGGVDNAPANGLICKNNTALIEIVASTGLSKSKTAVTACIIGASIEAGTTHETASSGAVINPAKAYLTVALQNNGVTVTNLSKGGMGFVRPASADSTTMKDIVDGTDFTDFDSVYVCLGYNDYQHNQPLGATTDSAGTATVCGMLKYCIETIYTSNPSIKLFIKKMGGSGGANSATVPYTQAELETAMETICASYGVEMILLGAIVNNYNRSMIYPDGVHPSQAVMAQMAKDTTGRITFK